MRKADLRKIHDRFEKDLQQTRERLMRLETLIKQEAGKQLIAEPKPESDLTWLFEAGCLTVYARWVTFTQELVVALLNRNAARLQETLSPALPSHLKVDAWEALLTWKRHFPTDPEELKGLAKDILATNPFGRLRGKHWKLLGQLHATRNAVAHPRSRQAQKRYEDKAGANRSPGPFLKARVKTGRDPRLVEFVDGLIDASKTMRKAYTSLRSP